LPALELTTGEAVAMLKGRRETEEVVEITEKFLSNADMVKFAKYQPMESVNREMMVQAKEIVERTKIVKGEGEKANV
jgi:aspartate carbamoyltransferase regulatory subunit